MKFREWIAKLDDKEPVPIFKPLRRKTPKRTDWRLPGRYDHDLFVELLELIVEQGPGSTISSRGLIDSALTWDTHSLERDWYRLYDGHVITDDLYDCALCLLGGGELR